MATKEEALQSLADAPLIMLASADGDQPCIRVIDHLVHGDKVVFVAHGKSAKITQFQANNKVAFAAVSSPAATLKIRCNEGIVAPSDEDVEQVKAELIAKRESIVHMLNGFGENAVVYEISFPALLASARGREERVEM